MPKIRVRFWDQMVLVGIGLALFYTIFESILSIFLQVNVDFMQRVFGTGPGTIYSRLTVLCLFAIFGSHAQYTINQRKAAEAALRESEERFRHIIENSPVGYFELDLAGNFTFFNDATCDILGYSANELGHKRQSQVADDSSRSRLKETFERVLASAETAKFVDWVIVRRDGSKRFAESSFALIRDRRGRPLGFSVFMRDITERKRSEALMRAKLAAEAASRSKGEFLASMSHEIRTPLNAIIGLVELQLGTELSADQREDLDVVKSSAYALLAIINNVLDFSKIEAGKLELEQTRFSLETFLNESARIMAMKAHLKGLELAYRMDPGVPDQLIGDPNRLRQVILNLVDNAIKFTERGEVIVHVTRRAETPTAVRLQFTVTDTGVGVPPDKQQRIFMPYDQGDPAVARRFGGTGLGLAVSNQLVRMMGGRMALTSRPGHGSAFGFTALFGLDSDSRAPTLVQPSRAVPDGYVLVVDDNAAARRIVADILERQRMNVRTAGSADEARQAYAAGPPPKAVLVDSNLPGTDGFACVAWLRQAARFCGPVILMLSFVHLKRKSECAGLGVNATLLKPFGPRELMDALATTQAATPECSGHIPGGATSSQSSPAEAALPAHGSVAPAAGEPPSLRILVAEDTPVNQKFILRLLDRWGHSVVLVEDGRKAVTEASNGAFDLILMDVQMPEMDGLEAAAAIRRCEREEDRHTPMIAMTAHAVQGDRERCLAAGMDDYLSKPIDAEMLKQTIGRLTGSPPAPGPSALPGVVSERLSAFGMDWSIFKEVAEAFLSDYPRQLESLRTALERGDAAAFRRAAHSLKGMLRGFQAEDAAEKAFILETKGQTADMAGAGASIEELAGEIRRLDEQLRSVIDSEEAEERPTS